MVSQHTNCAMRTATAPAPPQFQATLGRRPSFCSQSDAAAYDAGYLRYENRARNPVPFAGTPAWRGWMDAEADLHQRIASRGGVA